MTPTTWIVVLFIFWIGCFIAWQIGYRAGYEAGREHELDKAAKRHVRMSRFRNMEDKPNHWSDIING